MDENLKAIRLASRWVLDAPSDESLIQACSLYALAHNKVDASIKKETAELLAGFVADTLMSIGILGCIVRGDVIPSVRNGEIAFSLTEQGRERGASLAEQAKK